MLVPLNGILDASFNSEQTQCMAETLDPVLSQLRVIHKVIELADEELSDLLQR
jgi:hypothetical protein